MNLAKSLVLLLIASMGVQCASLSPNEPEVAETCEVHGIPLLPERVRTVRSEDLSSQVRGFLRGYGHRFPNAREFVVLRPGDAQPPEEAVDVVYCSDCREVRQQCLLEAFS